MHLAVEANLVVGGALQIDAQWLTLEGPRGLEPDVPVPECEFPLDLGLDRSGGFELEVKDERTAVEEPRLHLSKLSLRIGPVGRSDVPTAAHPHGHRAARERCRFAH